MKIYYTTANQALEQIIQKNVIWPFLQLILKGFDDGNDFKQSSESFWYKRHKILPEKPKIIRFSKGIIQWFTFYLSEQIVFVNIESKFSDFEKKFLCGTTIVYLRSSFILDLCDWYTTSSQINFTFICRWLMHLVPTQRIRWNKE